MEEGQLNETSDVSLRSFVAAFKLLFLLYFNSTAPLLLSREILKRKEIVYACYVGVYVVPRSNIFQRQNFRRVHVMIALRIFKLA